MKTILHTVHIHASPEEVYRALTTREGVTGWWTTEATVEPGEGGVIAFTFHGDFHPRMEQTDLEENRLVRWRCVGGHDNWLDNTFTFAVRERDGETSLRFVQEYARELDDDTYGTYNFNWGYYLHSLKKLCEEGDGTPFEVP
ncbi:MAG: SRPBCC domain-containing protein [Gemmatimonadota bacterium]|nr:SRPBCC domain-containing protein [Gemmatimonadota bacterium]